MPTIPCDECDATFKNMVQLKNHRLGGECPGQAASIAAAHAEQKADTVCKFDFYGEGRPADIFQDFWKSRGVAGAHHSAGGLGSLGVHFLQLKDSKNVAVLKQGSADSAADAFCASLYNLLGVRTPKTRVLSLSEWQEVLMSLRTVPFTEQGAGAVLQDSRAKQAGGTVQEFVRGFTIKDPRAGELFESASAAELMQQLGSMMAVDMLVNNFDRSPLIWSHQGNANNFMFSQTPEGPVVVAIDNTTQAITHPDGAKAYYDKVTTAVREACQGVDKSPYITKVRDFVMEWAKRDIGADGCKEIQAGIAETAKKIIAIKNLSGVWEDTFKAFTQAGWGEAGISKIDMTFVEKVRDAMAEAIEA